jgi:hypothetical protein
MVSIALLTITAVTRVKNGLESAVPLGNGTVFPVVRTISRHAGKGVFQREPSAARMDPVRSPVGVPKIVPDVARQIRSDRVRMVTVVLPDRSAAIPETVAAIPGASHQRHPAE